MMLEITDASGNTESIDSLKNIAANTKFGVQTALYKSGKDIHTTFNQQVLAKNKTGRIYIKRDRLGRKRKHQASASDESPANRTGNYRKSAGFQVNGSNELIFGTAAEYAGFLELGTPRMEKRPGLGNAISANERNIIRDLTGEIQDAI